MGELAISIERQNEFRSYLREEDITSCFLFIEKYREDTNLLSICFKYAIVYERMDCIEMLLDYGADIDIFIELDVSCVGYLILDTIETPERYELLELLLKRGAAPNKKFAHTTPLYVAIIQSNTNVVELLLKYGADMSILPTGVDSYLQVAQKQGVHEIEEMLLISMPLIMSYPMSKEVQDYDSIK